MVMIAHHPQRRAALTVATRKLNICKHNLDEARTSLSVVPELVPWVERVEELHRSLSDLKAGIEDDLAR